MIKETKRVGSLFTSTSMILAALLVQGCASNPVITGFDLATAEEILTATGTSKPPGKNIGRFYSQEETYTSFDSTWECNRRRVIARVNDLILTFGQGNSFEGIFSTDADCEKPSTRKIAGRYFDDYLYLYFVEQSPRYIFRYQIRQGGSVLDYKSRLVLSDGKREFIEGPKHADPVTGRKKSDGGQADVYETSQFLRQDKAPSISLAERRRDLTVSAGESANQSASEWARQEGERAARDRRDAAEERANTIASLNRLANDYDRQLDRRRSQASGSPPAPSTPVAPAQSPTGVSRPSADGSRLPHANLPPPKHDSQPMWTYNAKSSFEGVGLSQAEGCKGAEKQAAEFSPTMGDTKRKLLNKGSCSCTIIPGNPLAKPAFSCRIPYAMEITSPNKPNTVQRTSEGVSR